MSIHNSFQNNLSIQNFFEGLNKHTLTGTQIFISFLDKDILFQNKDTLYLTDGSFMLKNNQMNYYTIFLGDIKIL